MGHTRDRPHFPGVRRYRIVYQVNRRGKSVKIMAVGHRRTVYEELAAAAHRRGDRVNPGE
jgi:hypothetical protein